MPPHYLILLKCIHVKFKIRDGKRITCHIYLMLAIAREKLWNESGSFMICVQVYIFCFDLF